MPVTRRRLLLTGLAGLGTIANLPAWAQAIGSQSDPWAQVDPYDDPRNGFPSQRAAPQAAGAGGGGGAGAGGGGGGDGVFRQGPRRQVTPEEERQEIALGSRDYLETINQESGGLVSDARIQQAMQSFITPLARVTDRRNLPWEARVGRDTTINAWALGGGKMAFNAGLIAACDHPGELMAVVAHEMGHVDCMHSLLRQRWVDTLRHADQHGMLDMAKMSAEGLVSGGAQGASVFDLLITGFSRENEYEADEHSVELMRRAGMDPSWTVSLMRKLERQDRQYGHHMMNELLSSHPKSSERAANLESRTRLSPKPKGDMVVPGWDVLKAAYPTLAEWRNT